MPDISKLRKRDRPKVYDPVTKTELPISIDMETWILNLSDLDRRGIVQRLRTSTQQSRKNLARDNLAKLAFQNMRKNAGLRYTELNVNLADHQKFVETLGKDGVVETDALLQALSFGLNEAKFHSDLAKYDALYATVTANQDDSSNERKRVVSSWINVISTYIV